MPHARRCLLFISLYCLLFPLYCSLLVFHLFHGRVDDAESYYGDTSSPLPSNTAWHRSIRGAVKLYAAPSPLLSDPHQGPALRQGPQLGDRQRSVIIKRWIAPYQVCKVGEHWRGHLADDLGEVCRYSEVGGDG